MIALSPPSSGVARTGPKPLREMLNSNNISIPQGLLPESTRKPLNLGVFFSRTNPRVKGVLEPPLAPPPPPALPSGFWFFALRAWSHQKRRSRFSTAASCVKLAKRSLRSHQKFDHLLGGFTFAQKNLFTRTIVFAPSSYNSSF